MSTVNSCHSVCKSCNVAIHRILSVTGICFVTGWFAFILTVDGRLSTWFLFRGAFRRECSLFSDACALLFEFSELSEMLTCHWSVIIPPEDDLTDE